MLNSRAERLCNLNFSSAFDNIVRLASVEVFPRLAALSRRREEQPTGFESNSPGRGLLSRRAVLESVLLAKTGSKLGSVGSCQEPPSYCWKSRTWIVTSARAVG